jgi:hypothetical protein
MDGRRDPITQHRVITQRAGQRSHQPKRGQVRHHEHEEARRRAPHVPPQVDPRPLLQVELQPNRRTGGGHGAWRLYMKARGGLGPGVGDRSCGCRPCVNDRFHVGTTPHVEKMWRTGEGQFTSRTTICNGFPRKAHGRENSMHKPPRMVYPRRPLKGHNHLLWCGNVERLRYRQRYFLNT